MAQQAVTLRPATAADMAGVFEIHKHYTLKTVTTFKVDVTSEAEHLDKLKMVQSQHLPYVVAILPSSFEGGCEVRDCVIGYTYCSNFRGDKAGYLHTVELSLFCHPDHLYQGVGTLLLNKVLEVMKAPDKNKEWIEGGMPRSEDSAVRQIIACMAIDETGKHDGYGLKMWYEKFGFEEVGHLKNVGYKLDRW